MIALEARGKADNVGALWGGPITFVYWLCTLREDECPLFTGIAYFRGEWRAQTVFKESALGRFFHRVAMSVCLCV